MRVAPHEHRITCEACDGDGQIEVYIDCGKPASICCGGCSETVDCPDCDGTGHLVMHCGMLDEEFECIDCNNELTLTNHE